MPLLLGMANTIDFYIGTYTSPEGSKGIYSSSLNLTTGALSTPNLVAETPSPSYVAPSPDGKFLYAVNEGSSGEVRAFSVASDGLTLLNTAHFEGAGPCHLSVSADGRVVYAAAYTGGSAAAFPVQASGSLGAADAFFHNVGAAPKMHMIEQHGSLVYACDLGTNEFLAFDRHLKKQFSTKLPEGSGPRHFAIHPSGRWAFVNTEYARTVVLLKLSARGAEVVQTLGTLPDDAPQTGSTAEIACDSSGRFVYVSNRGHDSVALFKFQSGRMERVGVCPLSLRIPRGFAISPDGKWLVAGGQDSGWVKSYRLDGRGLLGAPVSGVTVDKPVCIAFSPGN